MHVLLKLTGVSPLVMHNIRLADAQDEFTRAIKEITSKRNRTDSDNADIEKLEWHGGLYHDPDLGVYIPTWNVVKCLERAGVITKKGTDVLRAVAVTSDKAPLQYDGPRDLAKLWEKPEFRWRTTVGVQRAKVPRMRPIFRKWALELEAEMLEDVLNPGEFDGIVQLAGRTSGLGDARKLGYGRFTAEVLR